MSKNPKLFREMSEPHETKAALDEAIEMFGNAVSEARKQFKLKNVGVVIMSPYLTDADEEIDAIAMHTLGDSWQAEGMFAYGFGTMRKQREDFINKLLKSR